MWECKISPSNPHLELTRQASAYRRCWGPGFVPKFLIFLHSQWPVLLPQTQPSAPCLILQSHFSLEKDEVRLQSQSLPEYLCVRCWCCFPCSPSECEFISSIFAFPRGVGAEGGAWFSPTASAEKKQSGCLTRGCSGFGAAHKITLLRYLSMSDKHLNIKILFYQ